MAKVQITIECDGGLDLPIKCYVEDDTPSYRSTEMKKTPTAEQVLEEADNKEKTEPAKQITREQQKRYDIASELANVCEYLEEVEIMKLQIIIEECKRRVKR